MPDIFQYIGSDLTVSPTGDLLPVSGTILGQQRVLRRLLTNPGDYPWHPTYGGGLPAFIGKPASAGQIQAIVQQQMLLEDAVAQSPPPVATVTFTPDGTFFVSVKYTDALTGAPLQLSFDIDQ